MSQFRICAIAAIACYLSVACSLTQEGAQGMQPNVNIAMGMSVSELRASSTYQFGPDPSAGPQNIGTYEISTPYNLILHNGEREILIQNVGVENQSAFIIVNEGRVTNFVGPVHRGLLTLDEAIQHARLLSDRLRSAGLIEGASFHTQDMARGLTRPVISNLDEAQAALADPNLMISEMSLFVAQSPELSASLTISSGPRMRALQSAAARPSDPVRGTIRDLRGGREWTLQLEIGASVAGR